MTFEEAWAAKEKAGYQYGADALEQVKLGWEMGVASRKAIELDMSDPDNLQLMIHSVVTAIEDGATIEASRHAVVKLHEASMWLEAAARQLGHKKG